MIHLRKCPPPPRNIDEILAQNDEFGLLANVQPRSGSTQSVRGNNPVINNFLDIVDFVREHGREPALSSPEERSLARRLRKYRESDDLCRQVSKYDHLGLLRPVSAPEPSAADKLPAQEELQPEPSQPTSLDDIFASDTLGLLDDINFDIFDLQHVKTDEIPDDREVPDVIGRQRPCANFDNYRKTFENLHKILKTDAVIRRSFKQESSIRPGQFFLLRGQLCYIAERLQDRAYKGRDNPRLLVIFDNQTEIEILKLSLARALYADKQSKWLDLSHNLLSDGSVQILPGSTPSGYIYILATESTAPELAHWKLQGNLVKIGFTTTSVEERLRNVEKDRTYLCAPVKLLCVLECYNLNIQLFEKIIHAFLNDRRLGITMIDNNGKRYRPEEWFTISAETALAVARRIIDGTISHYRLDSISGTLKPLA